MAEEFIFTGFDAEFLEDLIPSLRQSVKSRAFKSFLIWDVEAKDGFQGPSL